MSKIMSKNESIEIRATSAYEPWYTRKITVQELLDAPVGETFVVKQESSNSRAVYEETATIDENVNGVVIVRIDTYETPDKDSWEDDEVKEDTEFISIVVKEMIKN